MKRFLILLIALTTIFSIIGVSADTTDILYISLEEAKARALENSVQYRLQTSEIKDASNDYDDASDADVVRGRGFMDYFSSSINYDVTLENASNSLKLSRLEKEYIKRTSDNDVTTAFINIMKAQYSLEDTKNTVYLKKKDLEIAKIKNELGYITSSELKTAEKSYTDSEDNIDIATEKLHQEIQKLNKLLGRSLTDYNIAPVFSLQIPDAGTLDMEQLRKDHINNDMNLLSLSKNANLAQRKYDLTKERYEHFTKDMNMKAYRDDMDEVYDKAERDYEKARNAFEDATKTLDITLNSSYTNLKDTRESINKLIRDLQDQSAEVEKAKLKYDLGILSKNDYESINTSLKTMQNKLQSAIGDYNLLYNSLTIYSDINTTASK